ncbi:MAG: hypothetical protein ABIJ34_00840 [archaeon]
MVKANVDKILEYLRERKTASIGELSKKLTLKSDDIQKSSEYLEQDGVVKIEHKFPYVMVTLVKDPEQPKEAMPLPPPMSRPSEKPQQNAMLGLNTNQQFNPNFQPPPVNQVRPMTPQIPPTTQVRQAAPPVQLSASTINIVQTPTPPQAPKMQNAAPTPAIPNNQQQQPIVGPQIPQMESPIVPKFSGITPQHSMNPAPQFQIHKQISEIPEDPLDMPHPNFELAPPSPGDNNSIRPTFVYEDGLPAAKKEVIKESHIEFPSYIQNDADKIEFLLDMIEKKIDRHDYPKLNTFYRTAYDIYNSSTSLSPNEMYLIGEKLRDKFDRLKHVYLIENAV